MSRPLFKRLSQPVLVLLAQLALGRPTLAALPLSDVLERMAQKQRAVNDLQFDFIERTTRPNVPPSTMKGKVAFKRPSAFRVLESTPDNQVMISDGKRVWIYSPEQHQQMTGNWAAWVARSRFPLPLLDFVGQFSPETWKTHYKALFGGYNDHRYEIVFRPLTPGDQAVTLYISEETFLPVEGRVKDGPSVAMVSFSNMRENSGLKSGLFNPKVPPGTEVIPMSF